MLSPVLYPMVYDVKHIPELRTSGTFEVWVLVSKIGGSSLPGL